jgi:hypothetical protein
VHRATQDDVLERCGLGVVKTSLVCIPEGDHSLDRRGDLGRTIRKQLTRLRIFELVRNLRRGEQGVDRDGHNSRPKCSDNDLECLDAVAGEDRYAITLADSMRAQVSGKRALARVQLFKCPGNPTGHYGRRIRGRARLRTDAVHRVAASLPPAGREPTRRTSL